MIRDCILDDNNNKKKKKERSVYQRLEFMLVILNGIMNHGIIKDTE